MKCLFILILLVGCHSHNWQPNQHENHSKYLVMAMPRSMMNELLKNPKFLGLSVSASYRSRWISKDQFKLIAFAHFNGLPPQEKELVFANKTIKISGTSQISSCLASRITFTKFLNAADSLKLPSDFILFKPRSYRNNPSFIQYDLVAANQYFQIKDSLGFYKDDASLDPSPPAPPRLD